MHHLVSRINFLTLFRQPRVLDLIYLLQIHHFFLITSAYQFQHHDSLLPSPLQSFILSSKPFFSINPTSIDHWYPPDWFHWLLDCSSAFLAQQYFSVFSYRFPLQLFFSSLLLSTPLLVCFSVNLPHYHRFLVFFVFITFSFYALD